MATKRPAKKSGPAKKSARKKSVLRKAQQHVRQLLKQEQAGTLTRVKLEAGLKEIQRHLEVMDVHIHSSL
jgi:hypothetical protein